MKKSVISSAVLIALFSGSTLAATVYQDETSELKIGGRAEARFNVSDNNESATDSSFKDKSRARVNLNGKTKLDNGLYGFGKYEAEMDTDNEITNRYVFAGIGGNFGEFSYGKQDSAQVQVTDFTDTMATFGADAADLISGNKDKRENNFVYKGKFNNLTVKANYISATEKDSDSYGISGVYELDFGLTLGAGYVTQDAADDADNNQFNIAGQYKISDLTIAALYVTGKADDADADGIEASAKYKLGKTTLVAVYNNQQVDDQDTVDNVALEAVYKFNGNLRTYAGYKFEQIDGEDDQLQAGIRYDF